MTDSNNHVYTTAEVAHMFAVSPKTVTRWADLGWVTPVSTPGGHRRYHKPDIDRLRTQPHRNAPSPRAVLEAVVHEHFGGDALAALVDLAARFGIEDEAVAALIRGDHPYAVDPD